MSNEEIHPTKFWSSPEAAIWWTKEDSRYEISGLNRESEEFIQTTVARLKPESVLEVGAGTGRLISKLGEEFPWIDAHSADVNALLCEIVSQRHPGVITHEIVSGRLPFSD